MEKLIFKPAAIECPPPLIKSFSVLAFKIIFPKSTFSIDLAEPIFILKDVTIDSIKIIKNKHLLIFFENDIGNKIKGICFNSKTSVLGGYLEKFNQYKFLLSCTVTVDKFTSEPVPQIIIRDIMKID